MAHPVPASNGHQPHPPSPAGGRRKPILQEEPMPPDILGLCAHGGPKLGIIAHIILEIIKIISLFTG